MNRMRFYFLPLVLVLVVGNLGTLGSVLAADVMAIAIPGQPYGVATIEIPIASPVIGEVPPPIQVADQAGRVLFPISDDVRVKVTRPSDRPVPRPGGGRLLNRVGNLIREITNKEEDLEQTVARRVAFLFVGAEPLRVRVGDANGDVGTYDLIPTADQAARDQILQRWWNGYTEAARLQIDSADYPTWVENYLVAMLAGRLNLALPDWYTNTKKDDDELLSTLKLIAGAEGVGEAIFRRAAAGKQDLAAATLPVPAPPAWAPLFNRDNLAAVPVESLATRVPPECFYLRYGSFENYLWFRDLSDEYGGDLSKMVTLRGIENDTAARVETQLNMKTTELTRMLGATVIEDQAIIGRDLFMNDGASVGVILKAKNAFLLRTSLSGDRSKLARNNDGVTLKDIKIAGRPVSFLGSPDNKVRSFMAEDDGYFCIANSETLVRRFLEVGESGDSLGTTSAFRLSRQLMPLERQDTIFAYFSPQMLRGLVSPQYLIELRRRLHAKAESAMVHLAKRTASQESANAEGLDELIAAGFLPNGFGRRPDGSGLVVIGDQVVDTMRGGRGTYLPIADVKTESVTPEESAWYSQIASQYTSRFPTIDPIMVGIKRETLMESGDPASGAIERLTIHAEVAPWEPAKYGKYSQQLGPPTDAAMRFAPDDIIAVQAHVASPQLGPPTHLFAAIKDTVPPAPEEFDGILNIYRSLRQIPGYLGAWPQPGALDRLPLGLGRGQPVGPGMSRLIGGLYRYTDGQFSILSFYPDLLQASLPFLSADQADSVAQVRARIGNLNGSQISSYANAQLYDRAREGSVAGANFLNLLSRQLRVAPEDAMKMAERVMGAQLQCTLGGDYQYSATGGRWYSTAWEGEVAPTNAPLQYVAPAMVWFRGATASLTQYDDRLVADAVLDIARAAKQE
ncbi:MAG: hypothetical protein AB8B91_06725 [Rubripirellula sp.]